MHTSLILYAGARGLNASTFLLPGSLQVPGADASTRASLSAIGALRGAKHGGANEVAFEIPEAVRQSPDEAESRYSRANGDGRKSSSDSAIRSTRFPIRVTK